MDHDFIVHKKVKLSTHSNDQYVICKFFKTALRLLNSTFIEISNINMDETERFAIHLSFTILQQP